VSHATKFLLQKTKAKPKISSSEMGFIMWICRVFSSNQSTCIRIMDLGAEEEIVVGLRDIVL
jgi:hypothetical protein